MCRMDVQSMHQRGALQNDTNPRVAMTVDPALVTLGQAKPTLQVKIVADRFELAFADKQARQKAPHHLDHLLMQRLLCALEALDQFLKLLLPSRARLPIRLESRSYLLEVLDVVSERLLFRADGVQAAVDALRQSAELLLGEPPFFSSKFRWSDARTSCNAAVIRKPGGCSGPP
jgi:hypothetical protein